MGGLKLGAVAIWSCSSRHSHRIAHEGQCKGSYFFWFCNALAEKSPAGSAGRHYPFADS